MTQTAAAAPHPLILKAEAFKPAIDSFNAHDHGDSGRTIPNAAAFDWIKGNVPLLDCPDSDIQESYYFRWWTYRKHIRETPGGYVVTEFLPDVGWAGKDNTISCAAGHHIYEGRWIADPKVIDDYARFWFRGGGEPRRYSFWAADALYNRYLVDGDKALVVDLLPDLVENWNAWANSNRDASGLFHQIDDRDGMEVSIGGSGYRPTINSYMYGDAAAIAKIAEIAGKLDVAAHFIAEAANLRRLVEERLWDPAAQFYKVLPEGENGKLVSVRELHAFTPWYFNLPDESRSVAWKQLLDPQGFYAPYGPTTAERRDPRFMFAHEHECLWNGPTWPFATSITLTGMANVLNNYHQNYVTKRNYMDLLHIYAKAQRLNLADGTVVPWIDEDQNPDTGAWIARDILAGRGQLDRGKDYNHSTFCDLVINGLIGLRPRPDDTVEVNPLVPAGAWDWFCLDQIRYHGHWLTIVFDRSGKRYNRGRGLRVFADDRQIAAAPEITRLRAQLPPAPGTEAKMETTAGWHKYEGNPVLGGSLGTCFDIAVLREGGIYRMWFSWRPKKSIALVESRDGIHWSEPVIVLSPNPATDWEEDVNRPVLVRRPEGYHMWYTGQANGHSWIGYATSPDGKVWKRMSDRPVLSPELPWEQVALMSPHVLWDWKERLYRMWYSGGEQYEPNAIGFATSADGLHWKKFRSNPVFGPDPSIPWEQNRVAGCQVVKIRTGYVMFYIGYRDVDHAQIGVARSKDGKSGWERHPENPIIRPGQDKWDHDACYKPYAFYDGKQWMLWYNGRHGGMEQIGLATHPGENLWPEAH